MALGLIRYGIIWNGTSDLRLRSILALHEMLPDLRPRDSLLEPRLLHLVKPSEFEQGLDEEGVACVAQGAANDCASFGNPVVLAKRKGVAIRVGDQVIAIDDMVRISVAHQVSAWDLDNLAILQEHSRIVLSQKGTAWGPGEIVS